MDNAAKRAIDSYFERVTRRTEELAQDVRQLRQQILLSAEQTYEQQIAEIESARGVERINNYARENDVSVELATVACYPALPPILQNRSPRTEEGMREEELDAAVQALADERGLSYEEALELVAEAEMGGSLGAE